MRIQKGYVDVSGDQSPDEDTVVFYVQELCCRNPGCPNFQQVVRKIKNKMN
jgi:hypothetical protein